MRRDGYRRFSAAGIVTLLAVTGFTAAATPASAELVATNSCTATATLSLTGETIFGPQTAPVDVTIDADATAQNGVTLTDTAATITFAGSLVQPAVDFGLVADGDAFPAQMDVGVTATNATPAAQTAQASADFVVDIVGGVAQPLTATFELSDTSWTRVANTIPVSFTEASMTVRAEIDAFGGIELNADCVPTGTDPFLTVAPPTLPSAPSGLVVEPEDGRVAMAWNPPADNGGGLVQYQIDVFDSAGGAPTGVTGATTRFVGPSATAATFTGLQNGVAYRFRVRAHSAAGAGPTTDLSTAETPRPRVSIGDASTFEGNTGTRGLRFTVSLSAPTTKTVTVNYKTTSGTAKSTSDFTAKSGIVTIAAGKASVETSISIRGDLAGEPTESFSMTLSAPTNATLRRPVGSGKIINDDPGPQARRVSIGDASVEEGRTGTRSVRLTVSLSTVSTKSTTVKFTTSSATANTTDYTKTTGTVAIPAGTASAIVAVSVRGDTVIEANETFKVTLSAPSGAALGRSVATATILNDD